MTCTVKAKVPIASSWPTLAYRKSRVYVPSSTYKAAHLLSKSRLSRWTEDYMASAADSESPNAIDDKVIHPGFNLRTGMQPRSASCLDGTNRRTQRTLTSSRNLKAFPRRQVARHSTLRLMRPVRGTF